MREGGAVFALASDLRDRYVSLSPSTDSENVTMTRRSVAPLWLMGLTNSVFGMYGGIILISVPQLLRKL